MIGHRDRKASLYIRRKIKLFDEENHERKLLPVFFWANAELRKERSNILKTEVFSWADD